jgi:hypothetical protein
MCVTRSQSSVITVLEQCENSVQAVYRPYQRWLWSSLEEKGRRSLQPVCVCVCVHISVWAYMLVCECKFLCLRNAFWLVCA